MDTRNFDLYESLEAAKKEGVPDEHLVEIKGSEEALAELRANLEKVRELEAQHGKRKREE